MRNSLRTAFITFALLAAITGGLYPLAMTGVAQLLMPQRANGSIVFREGQAVGSELIGQEFREPKYFWGRLSATAPSPYDGGASSGSNLGPLSPDLVARARRRIEQLQAADPDAGKQVPADLVTSSGSGLDPHISPAAAYYQAGRVARARGLELEHVRALIERTTQGRTLGFLGEPRVNVLLLNLALDDEAARKR